MSSETQEFKGQRPRVNEAREFIEIAKDFKRPQELLREALSNSWDANASSVSITIDPASAPRSTKGRKKQLLNQDELMPEKADTVVAINLETGEYVLGADTAQARAGYLRRWPEGGYYICRVDGSPSLHV